MIMERKSLVNSTDFYVDCDYATAPGGSRVADVKKCVEYARAALS